MLTPSDSRQLVDLYVSSPRRGLAFEVHAAHCVCRRSFDYVGSIKTDSIGDVAQLLREAGIGNHPGGQTSSDAVVLQDTFVGPCLPDLEHQHSALYRLNSRVR